MSCVDREEGGGEKGCVPFDRDKTATRRLSSYQSSKRSVNAACFGRPNSRRGSWQNPPLPALIWVQPFRAAPDAGCHEAALPALLARRGATGSRPSARTRCAALPPALLGRGLPPAGTAGAACSPATACCPGQQSTPALQAELCTGRDRNIIQRVELEATFKDQLVQPLRMEPQQSAGVAR